MNLVNDKNTLELVAQAAAWRLVSLLLERPRESWQREIKALSVEINNPSLLSSAQESVAAAEEAYQKLFGPGGVVSPREVSYSGFEDPGKLMAELQAFYNAFAFQPHREEAVDHISVQASFVGYLFLKEAYARMQQAEEQAETTKRARERFLKEHVSRCARGMAARWDEMPSYLQKVLKWLGEMSSQPDKILGTFLP
jgi:nitrate reductase assembly molybdenum cofactor insertion protein NarJ